MSINRLLLYFLLILFPSFIVAQDVQLKRERTFTGDGLYGYMDGGADQYLEYGVSRLISRDVVFKGEEYTIDVYDFPSPEDAFGIYSLHIFKCMNADSNGCVDCLSAYQFQAIAGCKYVSIVFPSGSDSARAHVKELLKVYISPDSCSKLVVPDLLNIKSPSTSKLRFLRGQIALSSSNISLSKLLDGIHYTGIWLLPTERGSYKALVSLPSKEELLRLKAVVPSSEIFREGEDFLFIQGKDGATSEEDEHGGFGF